jgi:hypothetical protein
MNYSMLDKEVFDRFVKPNSGEIIEVRLLKCFGNSSAWDGFAKGVVSGYYDDFNKFSRDIGRLFKIDEKTQNLQIYFTLQVIDPNLIGRAFNELLAADKTTSDKDVLYYRWLPIDLDPVRVSGISSSDIELENAQRLSEEIRDQLSKEGWPEPMWAMSGNGYHLLYRLDDLPAQDPNIQRHIKSRLVSLSARFSNEHVHLDTTLFNPARIIKLYGSTAHKGTPVPPGERRVRRPHRNRISIVWVRRINSVAMGLSLSDLCELNDGVEAPGNIPELTTGVQDMPANPSRRYRYSSDGYLDIGAYLKDHAVEYSIKGRR